MGKLLGRHVLTLLIQNHDSMLLVSPINAGRPQRALPFQENTTSAGK
jgi:hypothetical protein